MILDWMADHLGWVTIAFIGLVILAVMAADRSMTRECDNMMKLARSPHDSLEVHIACNQMQSDFARNMAIGAAAGAVAGSASRR